MTDDNFDFQVINTFNVQLLTADAKMPVCAHPGQDLGYDLFAAQDAVLFPGIPTRIRTGIAVELAYHGFLLRDRSSMAARGITLSGGVIDAGYRGEIIVVLTCFGSGNGMTEHIALGDKICQMLPIQPNTLWPMRSVEKLSESTRSTRGFGSTGI